MEHEDRRLIPWWPDAGIALGGIGRTKVHQLIATGELPSVKIGRRRFVATRDLEEYIEGLRAAGKGATDAA